VEDRLYLVQGNLHALPRQAPDDLLGVRNQPSAVDDFHENRDLQARAGHQYCLGHGCQLLAPPSDLSSGALGRGAHVQEQAVKDFAPDAPTLHKFEQRVVNANAHDDLQLAVRVAGVG